MTAQVPDVLIYKRRKLSLCAEPLESYLETLPETRRPRFVPPHTACWRGYVATWKIVDQRLFLIEVSGEVESSDASTDALRLCFPGQEAPILATWVTAKLRCPEGEMLSYVHMGFHSLYERDRFFTVNQGVVEDEVVVTNSL